MNSLLDIASPLSLLAQLRQAATQYRDDAARLAADWQDKNAGKVWTIAADELDRAANKIEIYWNSI